MVEVKLTVANEDIPTVRSWVEAQKAELLKGMVAGQPTRKTGAATLLYTIVQRIENQLDDHAERVERLNREEKAARAARK
jgi:hypothetical protein